MASSNIVQPGDVLLVPCFPTLKGANADRMAALTIEWHQNWNTKKAGYYAGFIQVKNKPDTRALFFIASEWYVEGSTIPNQHISKIATKVGDFYEFKVDDGVRYGQKNDEGEARFIVYHDILRNPHQHRFMKSVLRVAGLSLGQPVAKMLGISDELTAKGVDQINASFGDPLRRF